jgi:glycosyltransferase involved in cell wall biosynthesis
MKKIKLLFFVEGLNIGGQQLGYFNMFRHYDTNSFQVHVLYVKKNAPLKVMFQKVVHSVNRLGGDGNPQFPPKFSSIISLFRYSRSIRRYIDKHQIDVIASNAFFSFIVSTIATIKLDVKHIRLVGGDLRIYEKRLFVDYIKYHKLYCQPDKYFGYRFMYEELVKSGVAKDKMSWDFHGHAVDSNSFFPLGEPEIAISKRELGITNDAIVIGWVGRLSPEMEVRNTIETCKMLKDKIEYWLLIVGDGPIRQELELLTEEYGIRDRVIFTGFVDYYSVNKYVNMMDVIPLLDLDPHGGGIIREGMSSGKVVITVNGKSQTQSDFIEHLHDGILISPNNQIEKCTEWIVKLVNDKALMKSLGHNAREKATHELSFYSQSLIMQNQIRILLK